MANCILRRRPIYIGGGGDSGGGDSGSNVLVKITGYPDSNRAFVTIGGTKYSAANANGISVPSGTSMTVYVSMEDYGDTAYMTAYNIKLNNKGVGVVASGSSSASYTMTLTTNATVAFSTGYGEWGLVWSATITTS